MIRKYVYIVFFAAMSCLFQRTSDVVIVNNCGFTIATLTIEYYNAKPEYKTVEVINLKNKSLKRLSFNSSDIIIEKFYFTINGERYEYEKGEIVTYGEVLRFEIMDTKDIRVTRE